jgi:hypothetical protein
MINKQQVNKPYNGFFITPMGIVGLWSPLLESVPVHFYPCNIDQQDIGFCPQRFQREKQATLIRV